MFNVFKEDEFICVEKKGKIVKYPTRKKVKENGIVKIIDCQPLNLEEVKIDFENKEKEDVSSFL